MKIFCNKHHKKLDALRHDNFYVYMDTRLETANCKGCVKTYKALKKQIEKYEKRDVIRNMKILGIKRNCLSPWDYAKAIEYIIGEVWVNNQEDILEWIGEYIGFERIKSIRTI